MKRIKISCVIGPASMKSNTLKRMIKAGMDGAGINLSHGDFDQYKKIVQNIKAISDIPISVDTQGPKIRIRVNENFFASKGQKIVAGFSKKNNSNYFDTDFYKDVKIGDRVLIHDGLLKAEVIKKEDKKITLLFHNTGMLEDRKGVNLPDSTVDLPLLTAKDKKGIKFALENNLDFINLSFTRNKENIEYIKRLTKNKIGIIAKIENHEGINNLDEILEVVDGIMVARGDLGVEISPEKLPRVQKSLIQKCNKQGKIAIVATELLESMTEKTRPTRAETSDIANAVLDGADCLMLRGETAHGKHPVESISELKKISFEVQPFIKSNVDPEKCTGISSCVSHSIFELARKLKMKKVVAVTRSGYTASMISRYRLDHEIIAITDSEKIRRKLELHYGIRPVVFKDMPEWDKILASAKFCYANGLIKKNELVIFTAGIFSTQENISNLIQVSKIADAIKYYKAERGSNLEKHFFVKGKKKKE